MRVPREGTTLLVDYGPPEKSLVEHHAGHSVYTRTKWLLFHAEQVAHELYGLSVDNSASGVTAGLSSRGTGE